MYAKEPTSAGRGTNLSVCKMLNCCMSKKGVTNSSSQHCNGTIIGSPNNQFYKKLVFMTFYWLKNPL